MTNAINAASDLWRLAALMGVVIVVRIAWYVWRTHRESSGAQHRRRARATQRARAQLTAARERQHRRPS